MQKYELTSESIVRHGRTLFRIRALKSFPSSQEGIDNKSDISDFSRFRTDQKDWVEEGDLGGFVQSESNLSQEGSCWLYDFSMAYDNSYVHDNAKLYYQSEIYDNAEILGNVAVDSSVHIGGNSKIDDSFELNQGILIHDNIILFGGNILLGQNFGHSLTNCEVRLSGEPYMLDYSSQSEIERYHNKNEYYTVSFHTEDRLKTLIKYKVNKRIIRAAGYEGPVNGFVSLFLKKCKNTQDITEIIKFLTSTISKKYVFTKEFKIIDNIKVFRIRALRSFPHVEKGSLGGFIQKHSNLSHSDNCWVFDDAIVFGSAKISGDATISDNARVLDNAKVFDEAKIKGNAWIYESAEVFMESLISGSPCIFGKARIYGNAEVHDHAKVYDYAEIHGNATVYNNAKVFGYSDLGYGNIRQTDQCITIGPIATKYSGLRFCTLDKESKIINMYFGHINGFSLSYDEFKEYPYWHLCFNEKDFAMLIQLFDLFI